MEPSREGALVRQIGIAVRNEVMSRQTSERNSQSPQKPSRAPSKGKARLIAAPSQLSVVETMPPFTVRPCKCRSADPGMRISRGRIHLHKLRMLFAAQKLRKSGG